ncbi:hypothetical protein C823_006555 [Eubacterium plexicaudatum ASF492]|nr:hypothetical protein C823_006555 [Eubacterium plexicaudatum ASF492]
MNAEKIDMVGILLCTFHVMVILFILVTYLIILPFQSSYKYFIYSCFFLWITNFAVYIKNRRYIESGTNEYYIKIDGGV